MDENDAINRLINPYVINIVADLADKHPPVVEQSSGYKPTSS